MKKSELIAKVSNRTGVPRNAVESVIDMLMDEIENALVRGDKITFTNYMSFETSVRPERHGVNPQTKEPVVFPAVRTVHCKVSQHIKDAINGKIEV